MYLSRRPALRMYVHMLIENRNDSKNPHFSSFFERQKYPGAMKSGNYMHATSLCLVLQGVLNFSSLLFSYTPFSLPAPCPS